MDGDELRRAVDLVGDRWTLLLVNALAGGPRRFGDLSRDVRGVAPNVLTDRLRRAERAGLISGTAYQHRPRRLVYELTPVGDELAAILPALGAWSAKPRRCAERAPLLVRDADGAALVVPRVRVGGDHGRRRRLDVTRAEWRANLATSSHRRGGST